MPYSSSFALLPHLRLYPSTSPSGFGRRALVQNSQRSPRYTSNLSPIRTSPTPNPLPAFPSGKVVQLFDGEAGGFRKMDRLSGPARLMIVSDLDHTMVDHHDPESASLLRFNALWETLYRHDSLLVFSTGRSPTLYKQLRAEKPLLTPDITIMSVGTEITYGDQMVPDQGWVNVLNQKWDKSIILEETAKYPDLLKPQVESEQRPHKVSFYVDKAHAKEITKSLSNRFAELGLDVKIIYSGGIDLDILPQGAGKGQALAYLLKKFKADGKPPVNTLACGDSGNDAELFSVPDVHGVMVSNAQEELLQWHAENAKGNPKIIHATKTCAAGIIEAIGHFGLGPNTSPRDIEDPLSCKPQNITPAQVVVNFFISYERWRRGEAKRSESFIETMKNICHPTGIAVDPSRAEHGLHECISLLEPCYGDKQGKQFRVWLDRVSTTQSAAVEWIVKFDKWELTDDGRHCCLNTVGLKSKPEDPCDYKIEYVHQSWLEGFEAKSQSPWFL